MGLFGFLGEISEAAVKVAFSPLAIAKDSVDLLLGEEPKNTEKLISSIGENIESGIDKLTGLD